MGVSTDGGLEKGGQLPIGPSRSQSFGANSVGVFGGLLGQPLVVGSASEFWKKNADNPVGRETRSASERAEGRTPNQAAGAS